MVTVYIYIRLDENEAGWFLADFFMAPVPSPAYSTISQLRSQLG
jgi:hypothetical protein